MKIVCIKKYQSQGLQLELTYGKIYESIESNLGLPLNQYNYWIINDRGRKEYYSMSDFVTIDEWRQLQIGELIYK